MQATKRVQTYRIRRTVYIALSHTPGAVFQTRLLDNQEGANIIPNDTSSESSLLARCFQHRRFWLPTLFQLLWRYRVWKIGPGGCDIHRRTVYGKPGAPSLPGVGCLTKNIKHTRHMYTSTKEYGSNGIGY